MKCRRCLKVYEDETDDLYDELDPDAELEPRPKDFESERICDPCIAQRAAAVPMLDVEAVFGKSGPLAQKNPRYEARQGQVRLSRAITNALAGTSDMPPHHLLAEGPCGIGKSKAYGIPAAHLAANGKRVLIVTASIALQEQLIKKDLPDLKAELGWDFDFALLKGKANYICRSQLPLADNSGLGYQDLRDFDTLTKWAKTTKTGDKGELLIKPADLLWNRFSTTSDACPGQKCGHYRECFATKAREKAADAGIIVTNYHLFFLHLASGQQILPASDVVILDEAHEAADIARDLLGFNISEYAFRRLAGDVEKRGYPDIGRDLREAGEELFATLLRFHDSPHYKALLRYPIPLNPGRVEDALDSYLRVSAKSHLVENALRLKRRLLEGLKIEDPNCVYSLEAKDVGNRRRVTFKARFISPAPVLHEMLWQAFPSVVAVSATLTTDDRFDFVRRELGVPQEARELIVESPFDFPRQALLVVPPSNQLPEPNDPNFVEVTAAQMIATIEACNGRTLGLFTSYKALNAIYERVTRHFRGRYTILRQGDAPANILTRDFKADVHSVLLATTSFWTGIDVPGEALTGLVIDKLPFGMPDDPVAIRIAEADPRAFTNFTVPKAILTLRQGVGRLIRSQADVGAVVLLDKRLTSKGYGARFLKSLPPMARGISPSQIPAFIASHRTQRGHAA